MTERTRPDISRRFLVKSIGAGAGVALAGCSGDGGSGDGTNQTGASTESDGGAQSGDTPLMWNGGLPGGTTQWRDWLISEFENRHGVSLEVSELGYEDIRQNFLTGAEAGDPDSIEGVMSHLTEYVRAGHLEPLDDRASELDFFDGYLDSAVEALRYDDQLYGLPYTGNGRALLYRIDVFDELGFEPPETADEFLEIGRTINSETDLTAYHNVTLDGSVRAFQEWISHVYQVSDQMFALEDDTWRLQVDADSLGLVFDKYYYQVWASDDPVADPQERGTDWQTNDYGLINGEYAMIECGPWGISYEEGDETINDWERTQTLLEENIGVAHLPYPEGGHRDTYLEIKPVMVNAHSDQKDMGWNATSLFASPDSMSIGAEASPGNYATPVHEDVESTLENENFQAFPDVFESGTALAKIGWGPVRQPLYEYMQQVIYGETDPYDAGQALHEDLTALEGNL